MVPGAVQKLQSNVIFQTKLHLKFKMFDFCRFSYGGNY